MNSPSVAQCLESEEFQAVESDSNLGLLDDSSDLTCLSLASIDDHEQVSKGKCQRRRQGRTAEREFDLSRSSSLTELPNEIILAILGCVTDKQELLCLSRVCQKFRNVVLQDYLWKPSLVDIAVQCDIQPNLLNRSDSIPAYLRWCAINRWSQRYEEAKRLLAKFSSENRLSAEEKEKFELSFAAMMPSVSPWSPSAYSTDEIVLKLPGSISVLPLNDMNAIQVFIELNSGAHKHELMSKGLSPVLEFVIYNPSNAKPNITCLTADIYHPLLEQSSKQLLLPHSSLLLNEGNADPASNIRHHILAIRDCFTRFDSIVSDFTL
jgi:hypothetical protein